MSSLTPTDVAFLMAGLMQAVAAVLWLIGGWVLRDAQRAAGHWSAFAGLSAASFGFLVAAMLLHDLKPHELQTAEWLRAAGNALGVLGLIALQRGIWLFIGRPLHHAGHAFALGVLLVVSWLGLDPSAGSLRIGVLSGLQVLLLLGIARDLHRHARDTLQMRWPAVLSLPLLLAALAIGARGARALLMPASVLAEMTVDSGLNVGSAFAYVVLTLSFHATLMVLVVTRLVADLQRLSRHDGLIGLLNRRALEETLLAQVQRSRRNAEPFCVLMIDADHFKNINDSHGHAVGDMALKHLSARLLAHMREVDRLARFGGEEFLVLLPGLALADALPVAERLREVVAAAPMVVAGEAIKLSVSIGMAEWGGMPEEASRLLMRVDAAMYQAKRHGRDRVVWVSADALGA
jgi:diguanylate cyclase (GGDEF)-like protein